MAITSIFAAQRDLVRKALTALLVAIFGLAAVMKITPVISPEVHEAMVNRLYLYCTS